MQATNESLGRCRITPGKGTEDAFRGLLLAAVKDDEAAPTELPR